MDEYTDRYIIHVCCAESGAAVLAPTDARANRGELVSVDVGTIHRDYIGDMFRVYALGEPPDDAKRIHEALDQVNEKMIAAVKPGAVAHRLPHRDQPLQVFRLRTDHNRRLQQGSTDLRAPDSRAERV